MSNSQTESFTQIKECLSTPQIPESGNVDRESVLGWVEELRKRASIELLQDIRVLLDTIIASRRDVDSTELHSFENESNVSKVCSNEDDAK